MGIGVGGETFLCLLCTGLMGLYFSFEDVRDEGVLSEATTSSAIDCRAAMVSSDGLVEAEDVSDMLAFSFKTRVLFGRFKGGDKGCRFCASPNCEACVAAFCPFLLPETSTKVARSSASRLRLRDDIGRGGAPG